MKPKILILRLSSLGDIVQASSVFSPLREAGCEIHFLVKPAFQELLTSCAPGIRVRSYNIGLGESAARADFFAWAEAQGFAAILDLHDTLRTKLWRRKLRKIAPVFVAQKPRWREFCIYILRQRWLGLGRGGRAERMRDAAVRMLAYLGKTGKFLGTAPVTNLAAPPLDRSRWSGFPSGEYLVLVPGSAWLGKRWPEVRFAAAARELAEHAPIIVLGGKEEAFCERIADAARAVAKESLSLHGRTTFGECAAILAQAKAILGNDTGLVHLAEAIGRGVVVVEGPTDPSLGYSAYREDSQLVGAHLTCRPCSKNGHPCFRFGSRACMARVSVGEVVHAVVAQEAFRGPEYL